MRKGFVVYGFFFLFSGCFVDYSTHPQWQYSAYAVSHNFYYTVEEIERAYVIRIFDDEKIVYCDPENYRMRDRFYLTWDKDNDLLWVYSSDIGTYCIYFENNKWIKKHYKDCLESKFDLPSIIIDLLPEGVY